MSTTTDVIYTHKKFKRVAFEEWGNRDPQKLEGKSPESKGLNEDKADVGCRDSEKLIGGYVSSSEIILNKHDCISDTEEKEILCGVCRKKFSCSQFYTNHECASIPQLCTVVKKSEEKYGLLCGSGEGQFSENPNLREQKLECKSDRKVKESKQIYKPKFQAHYSFNSGEEKRKTGINKTIEEAALNRHSTYQEQAVKYSSPLTFIRNPSPLCFQKSEVEGFHLLSTAMPPQCSGLWKGIKSPSPEVVNQHITNLIVQNQAIVETHNPLWSIKYRRQSNLASDGDNHGFKSRRSSVTDYTSKGNKLKNNIFATSSQERFLVASSSLPRSCSLPDPMPRASKSAISIELTAIKGKGIKSPSSEAPSIQNPGQKLMLAPQALDMGKYSSKKGSRDLLIVASEVGNDKNYLEVLPPQFDKVEEMEQVAALDLHKKAPSLSVSKDARLRFGEDLSTPSQLSSSTPPRKRRKFSNNLSRNEKPFLVQSGIDMLDRPRALSGHIFGGEVKICDGKEYKTLKIESIRNETPSLDMCIASKHLSEDSGQKEIVQPTSVVVTIAKCGLNSGGTMVKVENKYSDRKRPLSICEEPESIQPSYLLSNPVLHPLLTYHALGRIPDSSDADPGKGQSTVDLKDKANPFQANVISIGDETLPYIPGIPGPYSQDNLVVKLSNNVESSDNKIENSSQLQTPPLDLLNYSKDTETFLIPRQRPNSLSIKPQPLNLIGSTLVSPDTPRPKKSCAQLFLNGSAYTYLNLKVSTKTFFCCIYRPQPMYVAQSRNSKLSMYSNWQIRKTKDPLGLNLSPTEAMSLHISGTYLDRAYTIARDKEVQLIVTPSSYWTNKQMQEKEKAEKCLTESPLIEDSSEAQLSPGGADGSLMRSTSKRVKIFDGGFKTNEDYIYIKGRGRGRYVCETCGIRCKKPSMLKKHIRTHTDLRPFVCRHCSFSFKTKGNLTKHLKSKVHFKRCSEMGIVPVPVMVDETHINHDALRLQVMSEVEKGMNPNEEADDDEEDGDEDECDEEDEENGDVYGRSSSSSSSSGMETSSAIFPCNLKDQDDSSPMDLSIKRVAIADGASDCKLPCTSQIDAETKNLSSEILTPVMESSLLLRSIYSTTSSLDKKHLNRAEPMKEDSCAMLHAYLKERAVLDSVRKRHQCLYTHSTGVDTSSSPDAGCISGESNPQLCFVPQDNAVLTATSTVSSEAETTPVILLLDSGNNAGLNNCEISLKLVPVTASDAVTSTCESYQPSAINTASSLGVGPVTSSTPMPSSPTYILASEATGYSSPRPSGAPQKSSKHECLLGSSATMPTPPANLTVINNCETDAKPAFIAPSGIIPSMSNRSGSDDGKCKCSICHKEFGKQSQLRLHMNIHFIERPHRCNSCSVSFRTNGHLQKHKRSVSHFNKVNMNMTFGTPSTDNPRPFKCQDCKIAFRIHGHLAKHLRSKLHIMKLECLGKLPFGTYAEIERSGISLNEIDTSDCQNSLESLQVMALKLYEKEPGKLVAWQNEQKKPAKPKDASRESSSDQGLLPPAAIRPSEDEAICSSPNCIPGACEERSKDEPSALSSLGSPVLPLCEIGSGATEGLLGCPQCHQKFLDLQNFELHYYSEHKVPPTGHCPLPSSAAEKPKSPDGITAFSPFTAKRN